MMKIEKIRQIIDRILESVINDKVEGEIEIFPDGMFHIYLRPWRPYEMSCPYNKDVKEKEQ